MAISDWFKRRLRDPAVEPGQNAIEPVIETAAYAPADGVKLNLGCGFDHRAGWVNVDLHAWHKPDLVCDVTWLKPIDDNSADYALAQDILEHIHRSRAYTTMQEWNRVLKPGGLVEIRVPDVVALIKLIQETRNLDQHQVLLRNLFGTQGYVGDFHYNGFTDLTLDDLLRRCGFEPVVIAHHTRWLWHVVAKKVSHMPPDPMLRIEDDGDFLEAAYRKRLGRPSDPGGKAHFAKLLTDGVPREAILEALVE